MRILYTFVFSLFVSFCFAQQNDSLKITIGESTFDAQEVLINREIPWDLVWGDDNALWFTEKTGGIYRLDPMSHELHEVGNVNNVYVSPIENAGMHSMCFHPNWPDTSSIFVHYVYSPAYSRLQRIEIDTNSLKIVSSKNIFDSIPAARSHNGSRMTIDSTNNILLSMERLTNLSLHRM